MDLAFGVFNNRDKVEEAKKDSGTTANSTITGGSPNTCTTSGLPSLANTHDEERIQEA